jgi:hypothetical protein
VPATNKVGTQLLLSPNTRDRARALAIVRKERVAEIYRAALEGAGLKGLERQHARELEALDEAIAETNTDKAAVLTLMIRNHWTPAMLDSTEVRDALGAKV